MDWTAEEKEWLRAWATGNKGNSKMSWASAVRDLSHDEHALKIFDPCHINNEALRNAVRRYRLDQ